MLEATPADNLARILQVKKNHSGLVDVGAAEVTGDAMVDVQPPLSRLDRRWSGADELIPVMKSSADQRRHSFPTKKVIRFRQPDRVARAHSPIHFRTVRSVHAKVPSADLLREEHSVSCVIFRGYAEEDESVKIFRACESQMTGPLHVHCEHDIDGVIQTGQPGIVDMVHAFAEFLHPFEASDPVMRSEPFPIGAFGSDEKGSRERLCTRVRRMYFPDA